MTPDLSLLLVCFRSGDDLGPAVESFRREAGRVGVSAEVVIVEQSEDEAEVEAARATRPDRLVVQENFGYAAGVNRAIREARGKILLPANPDLWFHPGSLGALVGALEEGREIVGPQFRRGEFFFPPSEPQRPSREIAVSLFGRTRTGCRWWLRRELGRYRRVWEGEEPVAQELLSGALLAFRSETARAVGPWDEAFFLYFEESDWLTRARRAGLSMALVPSAHVEHRWGGSGGTEGGDENLFERSRRRYFLRHHGAAGRLALRWSREPLPVEVLESESTGRGDHWWLVSPFASGLPAARLDPSSDRSPREAAEQLSRALGRAPALTLWAWNPTRARVEQVVPP